MKTSTSRLAPAPVPAVATLLAALAALSACDDVTSSNPFEATDTFSTRIDAAAVSLLDLNGLNGTISITGSAAADSITIDAVKRVNAESQAAADEWLDSLAVQVTAPGGAVAVTTVQPLDTQGRNFVVDYEITIPDSVRVVIDNGNGAIVVTGLNAPVDINNGNGAVDVEDTVGNVTIEVGNGAVTAEAAIGPDGAIQITVGNGQIVLTIPQNTSAEFSAITGNGTITLMQLSLSDQTATNTSLVGTLGAGDGSIQLTTGNGTITVIGS